MDLLTQLRQDPSGFIATAAASLAVSGVADPPPAPPAASTRRVAQSGADEQFYDPFAGRWLTWGDDEAAGSSLGPAPDAIGPDGIHRDPPGRPPVAAPAPCPTCGCVYWWQDIGDVDGGNLHCCECSPIPSRRMAMGSWAVVVDHDVFHAPGRAVGGEWRAANCKPAWREYTPQRWRPFAHLDAARGATTASANDLGGF